MWPEGRTVDIRESFGAVLSVPPVFCPSISKVLFLVRRVLGFLAIANRIDLSVFVFCFGFNPLGAVYHAFSQKEAREFDVQVQCLGWGSGSTRGDDQGGSVAS